MAYDPALHHRRSIRLQGYDYADPGAYYLTICNEGKDCRWGAVVAEGMCLNDGGRMVERWLAQLPSKFPYVALDTHVVMPNHVHTVLFIHTGGRVAVARGVTQAGDGAEEARQILTPTVGRVVAWLKTMTTNEYIRCVKERDWPPFAGRLWQRNYHERILGTQRELDAARTYIAANPENWHQDKHNPQIG